MNKNELQQALIAANSAYIARKGSAAKLNAAGVQDDIASALITCGRFSDANVSALAAICDLPAALRMIGQATNVKKALRALDLLALLAFDDLKFCRASAKVFVVEYAGLLTAGVKTRSGLRFVATGKGNENTSDEVKVTQAGKLRKALGATSESSVLTQESVSWSKGGLGEIVGAIVAGSGARGKKPEIIEEAPIVKALDNWFSKLTDGKIALIAQGKKGTA